MTADASATSVAKWNFALALLSVYQATNKRVVEVVSGSRLLEPEYNCCTIYRINGGGLITCCMLPLG